MMSKEQWLEERRKYVNASEVPAILGENPWQSELSIWAIKVGKAEPPDLSDKPSVVWGEQMEPVVADHFGKRHPEFKLSDPGRYAGMTCAEHPWLRATVDRIITRNDNPLNQGALEIKCTGMKYAHLWEDGPDRKALIQLHTQMLVHGFQWGYICVLIGGNEYKEFYVERDPDLIATIITKTREFWDLVETEQPPAPSESAPDDTEAAIKAVHPSDDGTTVELTGFDRWHLLYQEAKANKEKWAKQEKHAKNMIRAGIGDAKRGYIPGFGTYSYPTYKRKGYEVAGGEYRKLTFRKD